MISSLLLVVCCYICGTLTDDVCSTENCNVWSDRDDFINVHLICHTHDDLGWLKTVDQYYWGSKQTITPVGVQYILNTVTSELQRNPDRRFSWAETGFLWRWMDTSSLSDKILITKLIQKGQLEIIGGGWVQNDEGAAHYIDIIDQMAYGLRKLNETFGRCAVPKIAWQIDPFGHSREMANIFALMGFEGLFFSRYHYSDKSKRIQEKNLELIWNASDDLNTSIFTGTFYDESYGPPRGFCFDAYCSDEPIMDQENMEGFNVDRRLMEFVDYVKEQASHQRTNHVMLLMGSDFHYTNANTWYSNLDRLIDYANKKENETKVRVIYSTPSCYYEAIRNSAPLIRKSDDFFPYASKPHSYWSGYFTSRPAFKFFIRRSTAFLQLAKQLGALAILDKSSDAELNIFRSTLALVQHHDAVTGTAKQAVTNDYIKRLAKAWEKGEIVVNEALNKLAANVSKEKRKQEMCRLMNETICDQTRTKDAFTLTIFNPYSQAQYAMIAIPYYRLRATVTDAKGKEIKSQLVRTSYANLDRPDIAPYQLFFPIMVPSLGFTTAFIDSNDNIDNGLSVKQLLRGVLQIQSKQPKSKTVSNGLIELWFDPSGHLRSYKDLKTGKGTLLKQQFFYYEGMGPWSGQASGAYIFRPNGTEPKQFSPQIFLQVEEGPLVTEVRQVVAPWVSQIIRLFKGKSYVEFEWTVGPIPSEDKVPKTKEIITRYTTDIQSNGIFYTDSNGRQMMQRRRNYAPTYEYNDLEPVAANYYPINSKIYIKDETTQLTILNDRSQGGSSLKNGEIEIMVHRRSFYDDGYGVAEALNEEEGTGRGMVVRGKHWLVISTATQASSIHRPLALEMLYQPILTFASIPKQSNTFFSEFSGLAQQLPPQLHLLTLEQWAESCLLLRLEHIYQNGEDKHLSTPVTVNLQNLFSTFEITAVKELSLGANIYKTKGETDATSKNRSNRFSNTEIRGNFTFTFNPMEIRTFKITIREK